MKKIEVNFRDYETGAVSPIDNIIVEDDYTPEDYLSDLDGEDERYWREHGEIIFMEYTDED